MLTIGGYGIPAVVIGEKLYQIGFQLPMATTGMP